MPERFLGRFLGKYRVDELIGSGGFAWVYRAFDPELEIDVALKVLKPQFAGDPQVEERFRREASTAAKLRHPNIITIHAVGREGDAVYFAMDYLPDGLAQRLETVAFLPEEAVVRIGIDVASALGFAHRQGVIHRDIKVDNILFDAHGNAVVADFGIARAVSGSGYPGQTGTNMVVGTPQYFAPEQARAKPLDGRADLYSLGVTLFRAATGQLPFTGDDWYEIARQHVEVPPPSPRTINPALSEPFERVLLHCLQKSPDDRPASGEALRQELAMLLGESLEHTALRSRIVSDQPTLVVDAITPSGGRRRRRVPPSVVAAGLVLAVAAATIPTLVRRTTEGGPPEASAQPAHTLPVTRPDTLAQTAAGLARTDSGAAARRDSVVSAVDSSLLRTRVLVTAPAGASIEVNGAHVGAGSWRADTLRPGSIRFTATLPGASDACESARAYATRVLRPGRLTTIALEPRPCGFVTFEAQPAGAEYELVSTTESGIRREGTVPLSAPIVVPPGTYRLVVRQRQCATYTNESVVVTAEQTTRAQRARINLICGSR